jgi:hypothetical protein
MKKPVEKALPFKGKATAGKRSVSKKRTVKKAAAKRAVDMELPKVSRLSYAEYVRRHELAYRALDEIEDEELENFKAIAEKVIAKRKDLIAGQGNQ